MFYFLPTRVWELLAGSLILFIEPNFKPSLIWSRILEVVGFLGIALSTVLLTSQSMWPSVWTLVPVLGAAVILLANRDIKWGGSIGQLLGQWSYSIYLWHWPVVVALIFFERQQQFIFVLSGIFIALILGFLSYTFVEKPFRYNYRKEMTNKGLKKFMYTASLAVTGLCAVIVVLHGMPKRMQPQVEMASMEAINFDKRRNQCHNSGTGNFHHCIFGGKDIKAILIGDSHAGTVASALEQALPSKNDGVISYIYSSCQTVFGIKKESLRYNCSEFNVWVAEQIKKLPDNIPIIIVNRSSTAVYGSQKQKEV